MYKQASRAKLRFETEKGMLTAEQLWDCTRAMLGRTIKHVHGILKETETDDDVLGFLESGISETSDPINTLRFNILKDVYITKQEEANALRDADQVKQHNAKIDAIIAQKEDESLASKSIKELEKLRK